MADIPGRATFVPNYSASNGVPSVGVGGLGNCDVPNTGFVADPIRPVMGCNGDTPRGCLAPLPVGLKVLTAAEVAPPNIADIEIRPVQPFYAVGVLVLVRAAAGPTPATVRLKDIRHEDQSILPRGFAGDAAGTGYDLAYLTMEAFRSGVNPWPRNSPIFVKERPLVLRFDTTGLAAGDTIDILLYARNMAGTPIG
jgi:hypothetical protein